MTEEKKQELTDEYKILHFGIAEKVVNEQIEIAQRQVDAVENTLKVWKEKLLNLRELQSLIQFRHDEIG